MPMRALAGRILNQGTPWLIVLGCCLAIANPSVAEIDRAASEAIFVDEVWPVLTDRCLHCHGPDIRKAGLRLDQRAYAEQGGRSGAVWLAGDADRSEIVRRVAASDPEVRMPPEGEPLTAGQIAALEQWITLGAVWPDSVKAEAGGQRFWSLNPIVSPRVPDWPEAWTAWVRNPIDAYVLQRLAANELTPSPEASRATLIRRLHYDLLGLPPSPEQIDRFVADPDPRAYERLVDELLGSPHYGERWARHWLDLVHFGETHGYDKDKPRPNAWPYRDYVIRAFNEDQNYSRFVREQLAGDALFPGTLDGLAATGFIASGPWDLIGHAEVSEDKIDGQIARHLDRDDMVTVTMNAFTGLTVQCARCHEHKFDPVSMEDYYGLQAVFAALDRADAEIDPDPQVRRRRTELRRQIAQLERQSQEHQAKVKELAGDGLKEIDRLIAELEQPGQRHPAFGYHSEIEPREDAVKWVQVDLGKPVAIERIEIIPAHDDYNGIGAGFGFPVRYRVEVSDRDRFDELAVTVADHTAADLANPGTHRQTIGLHGRPVRFVRLTATKLAPRSDDYIFALAEMTVLDRDGINVAPSGTVTALDSIESGVRWRKSNLVDRIFPGAADRPERRTERLAEARKQRESILEQAVPPQLKREIAATETTLKRVRETAGRLPPPLRIYVGKVHTGSGAFRGRGHAGGEPRRIRILERGDVTRPGKSVAPGTVDLFPGGTRLFELPAGHHESLRRIALANWIVAPDNPLTWRVIVNRIWQHHFGRGIVGTPNDFGRMGQRPTHPQLLDWLAVRFRDGGQSFKELHRLIVTSATYRQSSNDRETARQIDGENRYLWRMNRRRLDAESIRDSVLLLANSLDARMFGPSFRDFVIEKPEHSPHYQYHLHDPRDPKSHRRSVYRFLVRSQQQPFMTLLDCADPSMMVERRAETLTSLQALSMLNNRFMIALSSLMAENFTGGHEQLFYRITGRKPSAEELAWLADYDRTHGTANLCRTLLNLNEFIFVD